MPIEDEDKKAPGGRLDALEKQLYSNDDSEFPKTESSQYVHKSPTQPFPEEWTSGVLPKKTDMELPTKKGLVPAIKGILIGSVVLFLIAAGVAVYVFMGGRNIVSVKNVAILTEMPNTVAGGEKAPIQITVENANSVALISADLIIEYPSGAREADNPGKDLKRYREKIGDLASGAKVSKSYEAVFFGESGENKEIKISLEYRVEGSNAIFSKTEAKSFQISTAPVSVSILAPDSANSGGDVSFTIDVEANSETVIKNLMLAVDYPFGFTFSGAEPSADYEGSVWNLGDLKQGSKRTIKIRGTMEGSEGEERTLHLSVGTRDEKNLRQVGISFLTKSHSIMISRPFISLSFLAGGVLSDEYVTSPGGDVRGDIVFTNNLDTRITNIKAQVRFSGAIYDRYQVSPGSGFFRSSDNTIIWDQKVDSNLASMEPNDRKNLSFSFKVSKDAASMKNPYMNVDVLVTADRLDTASGLQTIRANVSKVIKIASQLNLDGEVLYTTGPFQNTGLVPPKAEKETTYTVALYLSSKTNDIRDAKVTTSLPIYVTWLGKVSPESENIKYNPLGGGIVWEVGDVLTNDAPKVVYFQVAITPSINQANETPALINGVSAVGTDRFSGVTLSDSIRKTLDISLTADPFYQGRGGPVIE